MSKPNYRTTTGFTVQIAFGSWAKPDIQFGNFVKLRICLGYMAISFIAADMENYTYNLLTERKARNEPQT